MNRYQKIARLSLSLERVGITDWNDQNALRLIELALHRWAEAECGDENGNAIERDEVTGKPYQTYETGNGGARGRYAIADKEAGALRRLVQVMAKYPHLWAYYQRDPRGCALYVGRYLDLPSGTNLSKAGPVIESCYTCGVAVCL